MSLIQNLNSLDHQLTLSINSIQGCLWDKAMCTFSDIPVWIPLYALVLFFLFRNCCWKKALIFTAAIALTFVACDQLSGLIKNLVQRPRPTHDDSMLAAGLRILEGKGGTYGFFSAHAANSFGFAISTSRLVKTDVRKMRFYSPLIFFWAALVSLSRIAVGKHFLGDILVGAIIGLILGLNFAIFAKYFADFIKDS